MNGAWSYTMPARCLALVSSIAMGALIALPDSADGQLAVTEVCTVVNTACTAPSNRLAMRRDFTETIKVKGPFVDHTQLTGVSTGNTHVKVTKVVGSNCGAVGCLDMTIAIHRDMGLTARVVPIFLKNVFGTTAFNIFVVRRGDITFMSQDPVDPVWGNAVNVVIRGTDIGDTRATVTDSDVANMDEAPAAWGANQEVTFTVVGRADRTAKTSTDVTLGADDVTGSLGNYRYTIPKRTVNYRAASGTAECATTPGITAPVLVSPVNGQTFTFTTNPVQASIQLRWGPSSLGAFKASEQFMVEVRRANGTVFTTFTSGQGVTSRTLLFDRNMQYLWRVRAFNCNQPGPWSAQAGFTVQ